MNYRWETFLNYLFCLSNQSCFDKIKWEENCDYNIYLIKTTLIQSTKFKSFAWSPVAFAFACFSIIQCQPRLGCLFSWTFCTANRIFILNLYKSVVLSPATDIFLRIADVRITRRHESNAISHFAATGRRWSTRKLFLNRSQDWVRVFNDYFPFPVLDGWYCYHRKLPKIRRQCSVHRSVRCH